MADVVVVVGSSDLVALLPGVVVVELRGLAALLPEVVELGDLAALLQLEVVKGNMGSSNYWE
jgi:hypothetical protein